MFILGGLENTCRYTHNKITHNIQITTNIVVSIFLAEALWVLLYVYASEHVYVYILCFFLNKIEYGTYYFMIWFLI